MARAIIARTINNIKRILKEIKCVIPIKSNRSIKSPAKNVPAAPAIPKTKKYRIPISSIFSDGINPKK
jgi:hypothetical protein